MKICKKCLLEKELSEFYEKNKSTCKSCLRIRMRNYAKTPKGKYNRKLYYEKNKDKLNFLIKEKSKNPEYKEKKKLYYKENKENYQKYNKEYQKKNRKYLTEYVKKWHNLNPEKSKKIQKKYFEKNKEQILKKSREYHKKNRKERNAVSRKYYENVTKLKKYDKEWLERKKIAQAKYSEKLKNSSLFKSKADRNLWIKLNAEYQIEWEKNLTYFDKETNTYKPTFQALYPRTMNEAIEIAKRQLECDEKDGKLRVSLEEYLTLSNKEIE